MKSVILSLSAFLVAASVLVGGAVVTHATHVQAESSQVVTGE